MLSFLVGWFQMLLFIAVVVLLLQLAILVLEVFDK